MKAQELRIGNWFSFGELFHQATHWDIRNLRVAELKNRNTDIYKPILLTEQWLLDFGFEKIDGVDVLAYRYKTKDLFLHFAISYFHGVWHFGFNAIQMHCFAHFQYVHQLQNLYFALTGEELELKK